MKRNKHDELAANSTLPEEPENVAELAQQLQATQNSSQTSEQKPTFFDIIQNALPGETLTDEFISFQDALNIISPPEIQEHAFINRSACICAGCYLFSLIFEEEIAFWCLNNKLYDKLSAPISGYHHDFLERKKQARLQLDTIFITKISSYAAEFNADDYEVRDYGTLESLWRNAWKFSLSSEYLPFFIDESKDAAKSRNKRVHLKISRNSCGVNPSDPGYIDFVFKQQGDKIFPSAKYTQSASFSLPIDGSFIAYAENLLTDNYAPHTEGLFWLFLLCQGFNVVESQNCPLPQDIPTLLDKKEMENVKNKIIGIVDFLKEHIYFRRSSVGNLRESFHGTFVVTKGDINYIQPDKVKKYFSQLTFRELYLENIVAQHSVKDENPEPGQQPQDIQNSSAVTEDAQGTDTNEKQKKAAMKNKREKNNASAYLKWDTAPDDIFNDDEKKQFREMVSIVCKDPEGAMQKISTKFFKEEVDKYGKDDKKRYKKVYERHMGKLKRFAEKNNLPIPKLK